MEAAFRLGGAIGVWLVLSCAVSAQPPATDATEASRGSSDTASTADAGNGGNGAANGANAPRVPLPTPEAVDQQLQEIKADTDLSEEQRAELTELYGKLKEQVGKAAKASQRKERFAAATAAAPEKLAEAREALRQLPSEPSPPMIGPNAPLEELRQRKAEVEAQRDEARERRQELETLIAQRRERRKALPQELADARARLQSLQAESLTIAADTPPETAEAKRLLRAAQLEAAQQEVNALQEEAKVIEAESDLLPVQLELAAREAARLEAEDRQWGQEVADSRESEIAMLIAEFQALHRQDPRGRGRETLELAKDWSPLVREKMKKDARVAQVQSAAAAIERDRQDAQAKVEVDRSAGNELSALTGLYLQHKRNQLPSDAWLQQEQAKLGEERQRVQSLQTTIDLRLSEIERRRFRGGTLDALAAAERQLLQEIQADADKYYETLLELSAARDSVINATAEFHALIERSVLWIRSEHAIQLRDFPDAWQAFQQLVHIENLQLLGLSLLRQAFARPDLAFVWLLGTFGVLAVSSRLRRRLAHLGEVAQQRSAVQLTPTLLAGAITAVLALPPAIGLAMPGWRLLTGVDSGEYLYGYGMAFVSAAAFVLPLELLRQVMRPQGLAVAHFGWPAELAAPVRRNIRWILDLGLPFAFAWGLAWHVDIPTISATVGRLAFVVLMVLIAAGLWRILHPRYGAPHSFIEADPDGWLSRLHFVWHGGITALPVGLAALSLAGYTYTAAHLSSQFYKTVWLATGVLVGGGLLVRWSLLHRRRLAVAQARQRLAQMRERQEKETGPVELPEEPGMDLTAVNAQTLRLIRTLMVVGGLVGLYGIWKAVLPALQFLEEKQLWLTEIPLNNVVYAVPLVILTIVAVRNLPGLLETTLLQQLPLTTAVRYAVTTLSTYALAAIGIAVAASTLGLRWENIQWLVAALGVGLGFGLQEIFANFISGLILLFEQPIRVGDVVTIDGTSGVVSRIRIRATTVINWDRQELIIPNKDLITGRLINWTLSDSMNRVLINVGVAYGSDTKEACRLLDEIMLEHENVVEDPPPLVTFDGFGDSALNLVARCYLKSLDVRLVTIHELHTAVNERFKEAGLEIAFPQRDLHIRSVPKEWHPPGTAQPAAASGNGAPTQPALPDG